MKALILRAAALAAVLATAAAAEVATPLRPDDRDRLDRLDSAIDDAMTQAGVAGVIVDKVPTPPKPGAAVRREALLGEWRCRITKMGGPAGVVGYDAFRCRGIRDPQGRVIFEKLTGSQRVRGEVLPDGDRLVLLGVGYIAGDTPPDYADLPAVIDTAATPQITSQPGVIAFTDDDHARILFPYPMLESTLDIMELTRTSP